MPTQAQREANMRLQAKRDRIVLWVNKDGTKARYQAYAESQGKSLNAYIVDLIEQDIARAAPPSEAESTL